MHFAGAGSGGESPVHAESHRAGHTLHPRGGATVGGTDGQISEVRRQGVGSGPARQSCPSVQAARPAAHSPGIGEALDRALGDARRRVIEQANPLRGGRWQILNQLLKRKRRWVKRSHERVPTTAGSGAGPLAPQADHLSASARACAPLETGRLVGRMT